MNKKNNDKINYLSDEEQQELANIIKESRDPTRYVVVSPLLDNFNLFYCVDTNLYAGSMRKKSIPECTIFKDINIAKAVRKGLQGKLRKTDLEIWKVKQNKKTKKLSFLEKVK